LRRALLLQALLRSLLGGLAAALVLGGQADPSRRRRSDGTEYTGVVRGRGPDQTERRYKRTAIGANTTRMPTHHATDCHTYDVVGPPVTRARTAEAVADTGWWFANACSHPGIELGDTNADDANTRGASTGKAAACAASGSPTARPTVAKIHDIE